MNKRPSKIVWANIPANLCNLDCECCYNHGPKRVKAKFLYSVEHMLKCFEPKRFGGSIFFSAVAGGETLLWDEIVDFDAGMLSYGHVVSHTTNMTITPVIERFCSLPREYRLNLELDASLHYEELQNRKLIDVFFENLHRLKSAEISYAIFLCITDNIIPYLREISALCQKEIGLLPIASTTRKYDSMGGRDIYNFPPDTEKLIEETCDTRQWKLHKHIYGLKRNEFCHSGEYALSILYLATGNYTKCWGRSYPLTNWEKLVTKIPIFENRITRKLFKKPSQIIGNLFENPDEPIKFEPIGRCPFYDCVQSSHLCWGLIPELDVETHSKTFFTKSSVSKEIWDFFDSKIGQQNE